MRKQKILLVVISVMLASCTLGSASLNQTKTPDVPTATRISSELSTPGPVLTSATPPATSLPTIPPNARLRVQCLDVSSSLPPAASLEGTLVLNARERNGIRQGYFLELKTGDITPLSKDSEHIVGVTVSPNRKWLAYRRNQLDEVNGKVLQAFYGVMAINGKREHEAPVKKEWWVISHWLDEERLVISLLDLENRPNAWLLLNPFTGEEQTLLPNFPNLYDPDHNDRQFFLFPIPQWENYIGETTYDAALSRVVYGWADEKGNTGYMLWDLQARQSLTLFPSTEIHLTPKWSPDYSQILIVGHPGSEDAPGTDLFSLSREGQLKQLTNLTAYYGRLNLINYSWSPNGRLVAFWYSTREVNERLAILDLTTQEVTDYCIPGDYGGPPVPNMFDEDVAGIVPAPIWSPDSQQLIVENRYAESSSRVILVDIDQEWAAQISENMKPVGWLK